MQFIHGGQQYGVHHRVHLARPGFTVHEHHIAKHAPEQGLPQLYLRLTRVYEPAGLAAATGLIEKLMVGKVIVVPDAQCQRQGVHHRVGEFALHNNLLGATACEQAGKHQSGEPALRGGSH